MCQPTPFEVVMLVLLCFNAAYLVAVVNDIDGRLDEVERLLVSDWRGARRDNFHSQGE